MYYATLDKKLNCLLKRQFFLSKEYFRSQDKTLINDVKKSSFIFSR